MGVGKGVKEEDSCWENPFQTLASWMDQEGRVSQASVNGKSIRSSPVCCIWENIFTFFPVVLKFLIRLPLWYAKTRRGQGCCEQFWAKSEKVQFGGKGRQNSEGEGRQRKTLFCSHLLTLQCWPMSNLDKRDLWEVWGSRDRLEEGGRHLNAWLCTVQFTQNYERS